jgi:hypothetical protein
VAQIKELQAENACLLASGQTLQAQHAECRDAQEEAQRMLALAQQREAGLATLLESAGQNALTSLPIDWSVPEARKALQTDEEDQLVLDRCAGSAPSTEWHASGPLLSVSSQRPQNVRSTLVLLALHFLLSVPGWSTS